MQSKWAKAVKQQAGYKCVICGSNEKLESHHIKPRSLYPEHEFNIENGLCLCHKCHFFFHNLSYANGVNYSDNARYLPKADQMRWKLVTEYKQKHCYD